VALAGLFRALDFRLATSQAVTLEVRGTRSHVSLDDPYAGVWGQAAAVEVPLTAQQTTFPMGGGTIQSITARALHDEESLYVLVEWQDDTQDTGVQRPQDFRDAAAVQFPSVAGGTIPFFCMGQADGHVNIWHWKADWQADIDRAYAGVAAANPDMHVDYYPQPDDPAFNPARAVGNPLATLERSTPIENLVAGGAGTLTTSDIQTVQGRGEWRDGRWRVLFARRLSESSDGLAKFASGEGNDAAFAVWNGSAGDRDGQKSVSQFVHLEIVPLGPGGGENTGTVIALIVPLGVLLVVGSGLGWYIYRRQATSGA
jgi:hypothetical protein